MTTQLTSVLEGIERAVHEVPDAPALQGASGAVSYREFGNLIENLATRLRGACVPGEFVGILGERGPGAVVAMIAAIRAQRPFVVLDARDSVSSNREKVALLGVRLLAQPSPDGRRVDLVEAPAPLRAAALPAGVEASPAARPAEALAAFAEGELAYAIHTSGSTGAPKCVLVRTTPLAAVVADHVERLVVGPGSTTLQFARLTFDACITEILWTLSAGARLVVLDEAHLAPGTVLQQTLERFEVTHLKTTPFALTVTEPSTTMRLQHVINGGGACRPAVIRKWSSVADVHNAYGLTETTVCNLLTGPLDAEHCRDFVPLGEPVGQCDYHLRDLNDESDVNGSTRGELVITGPSVAAGYLTRVGVQRFETDGVTAYPTGDVVGLTDGVLHYIERRDRQVKVRGYRIDPGEVENAVCRVDGVQDAVVVAEAHDATETSLTDALVCYYQGSPDPRSVRAQLDGAVDPYKIPSVFERIDIFPYTPNGKVDRAALQRERRAHRTVDEGASPSMQLLDVVRGLTGISTVELTHNFFDVGGDSASAIVLVAKLRDLGWLDAGIRDVLRADTLQVLADMVSDMVSDRVSERSV
ncbi:MAG: hypothetical protein DLM58_06255 [Pseudonocardiales bacterium]|nr:MAG: hypothetical protein DLM58_06255 [Pseudonocardiales bacterium]